MLDGGYSIQLKHDEKEEGYGWVEISLLLQMEKSEGEKEDSSVLVRHEDVMHNRNYYDRDELLEKMASEAIEALDAITPKKSEKDDKSDTEEVAPHVIASSE